MLAIIFYQLLYSILHNFTKTVQQGNNKRL